MYRKKKPPTLRESLKQPKEPSQTCDPVIHASDSSDFLIDPLIDTEDERIEMDEEQEHLAHGASVAFIATIAAARTTRTNPQITCHEKIEDGYSGGFFKRLEKFGIDVYRDDTGLIYFYLGDKTSASFLRYIDKEWSDYQDFQLPLDISRELQKELNSDDRWKLFLSPVKNVNGIQDSIMRTMILSKHLQGFVLKLLVKKLSMLSLPDVDEDSLLLGKMVIDQLRFVTQIFAEAEPLFDLVVDKTNFRKWVPSLRDQFVAILPELLVDVGVHSKTVDKLHEILMDKSLKNQTSLQQSCLEAIRFLNFPQNRRTDFQQKLLQNCMSLEPNNLHYAVEVILEQISSMDKQHKSDCLQIFFHNLNLYLNMEHLERLYDESESTLFMDVCLSPLFEAVISFMRMNVDLSKSVLFAWLNNNSFDPEDDDRKEVGFVHIMLLICYYEATKKSLPISNFLKKLFDANNTSFKVAKECYRKIDKLCSVLVQYQTTLCELARDFCIFNDTRVVDIGSSIFVTLLCSKYTDRDSVFKCMLAHFGDVELETSAFLTTIEEVFNQQKTTLTKFRDCLNRLFDQCLNLSESNFAKFMFLIFLINTELDKEDDKEVKELYKNRNYYISFLYGLLETPRMQFGVIGLMQYIKAIITLSDGGEDRVLDAINEVMSNLKEFGRKKNEHMCLFYKCLRKLFKDLHSCQKSDVLKTFGKQLIEDTKQKYFTFSVPKIPKEHEDFVYPSVMNCINMVTITSGNKRLVDDVKFSAPGMDVPFIALIEAVMEIARYCSSESDCWEEIFFVLESNIALHQWNSNRSLCETIQNCNMCFFTTEYLRVVLNFFSDCPIKAEKVKTLMAKKFRMMYYCENEMKKFLKVFADGHEIPFLPHMTHLHGRRFVVNAEVVSKDTNDESDDESDNESDEKLDHGSLSSKKNVEHVTPDQFCWYFTPMFLNTISKVIEVLEWKKREIDENEVVMLLYLVEHFQTALQFSFANGPKRMPTGYGFRRGCFIPFSLKSLRSNTSHYNLLDSVSNIFKILDYLSTQIVEGQILSEESTMKKSIQQVFQKLLSLVIEIFGIFLRTKSLKQDFQDEFLTTEEATEVTFDKALLIKLAKLISRNSFFENSMSENICEYFLEFADFCPSLKSCSDLLSLLEVFEDLPKKISDKIAKTALDFLTREWNNVEKKFDKEEFAVRIARSYIYFRSDDQKSIAVMWLVWYHLLKLYPEEVKRARKFNIGNCDNDPESFTADFCFTTFPCMTKMLIWYKSLFQLFVDTTITRLNSENCKNVDPKELVQMMMRHCETFFAFIVIIKNDEVKTDSKILKNILKQSNRFLKFFIGAKCPFSSFLRNDDGILKNHYSGIYELIQCLKVSLKIIYGIKKNMKSFKKSNQVLVVTKLLSETFEINESFIRKIKENAIIGGWDDSISIKYGQKRKSNDAGSEESANPVKKTRRESGEERENDIGDGENERDDDIGDGENETENDIC